MPQTDNGLSTLDRLAGYWLDYQQIKTQTDLENKNASSNMPDRVDVATGNTSTQGGVGGGAFNNINWQVVGVTSLIVLGIAVALKLVKR